MDCRDPELARTELAKILSSRTFASTERLRAFLRYVVEESLAGRGEQIKEYSVGISVYGKPADYDPKIDATVRGEANRLRSRLSEYYASEGKDARVQIRVRRGTYVPEMVRVAERRGEIGSVAVLPFTALGPGGGDDGQVLGLGLADAVITRMGPRSRVVLRPTSAIRRYAGSKGGALEAAHRLQVDAVVEGNYQVSGQRIRVSAQLLDGSSGKHLWAGTYNEEFRDIFAVQEAIAEQLAVALRVPLEENRMAEPHHGMEGEAFAQIARGRHHLLRATPQSSHIAVAAFGKAVEAAPDHAAAHAYLAFAWMQHADLMQIPYPEATPKVREHVEAALALEPHLPEAVAALATFQFRCLWAWDAAEASFRRAMELNPNAFDCALEYAALLYCLGRFDEGLELTRRALRLDPASPLAHGWIAVNYWFRREYSEALQWLQSSLELDPHFTVAYEKISWVYLKLGDRQRWQEHLLRGFSLWLGESDWIEKIRREAGPFTERELLAAVVGLEHAPDSLGSGWYSRIYANSGDSEMAFRCLENAYEIRSGALVYLGVDPMWDSIRGDARFQELLRKMRLG